MENTLPTPLHELFQLASKAADGLHSLATTLGITHVTEAAMRADLLAARNAENAYQAALAARLSATADQAGEDANARHFIITARDVLKRTLGGRYSQAWNPVGFKNHSLAVPSTLAGRIELLKSMQLFFTANPALEVASLNITAADAEGEYGAITDDVTALEKAWADQRAKRGLRNAAAGTLRTLLRNLIAELTYLISPSDPRWLDFGLNIPADNNLPEVPLDLTVADGARGHLLAGWTRPARALRFHVSRQVVGVDPDFVFARTTTDTQADLNTFTSGQHVRVEVTALNDAGESLPCAPVEHVVP
jgi:hypothetical protein